MSGYHGKENGDTGRAREIPKEQQDEDSDRLGSRNFEEEMMRHWKWNNTGKDKYGDLDRLMCASVLLSMGKEESTGQEPKPGNRYSAGVPAAASPQLPNPFDILNPSTLTPFSHPNLEHGVDLNLDLDLDLNLDLDLELDLNLNLGLDPDLDLKGPDNSDGYYYYNMYCPSIAPAIAISSYPLGEGPVDISVQVCSPTPTSPLADDDNDDELTLP